MNKIYLGSHVSMSSPDFYLGSVRSALEWGENTFMFYTGAPQNSYRLPLERLKIEEGRKLLKENYSYDEFREILITENLVTIDKGTNNTIPTQYAIDNKYIIVRKYYEDKNKYLFYITQNGINKILKK